MGLSWLLADAASHFRTVEPSSLTSASVPHMELTNLKRQGRPRRQKCTYHCCKATLAGCLARQTVRMVVTQRNEVRPTSTVLTMRLRERTGLRLDGGSGSLGRPAQATLVASFRPDGMSSFDLNIWAAMRA